MLCEGERDVGLVSDRFFQVHIFGGNEMDCRERETLGCVWRDSKRKENGRGMRGKGKGKW